MPKFLQQTIRLFCFDVYGCGVKKKTAKRHLERIAHVMEQQPQGYFFTSAFESVGRQLNRAIRKGLNGKVFLAVLGG